MLEGLQGEKRKESVTPKIQSFLVTPGLRLWLGSWANLGRSEHVPLNEDPGFGGQSRVHLTHPKGM